MVLAAVAAHFRRAGWTVLERPVLATEPPPFRPDLVLERRGFRAAVLIREEPPGPFEVANFARQCKRHGLDGTIISPRDEPVLQAAELHGLSVLDVEDFYAPAPALVTPPMAGPTAASAPEMVFQELEVPATKVPRVRWWRWAVVAAIWVAAITAVLQWIRLVG